MTKDIEVLERLDHLLFELNQREVKRTILDQIIQLAENLIKIAVFGIKSSWDIEFKVKIEKIQGIKCNTKKRLLNEETYFNLLYSTFFDKGDKWLKSSTYRTIKNTLNNSSYDKLQTPLRYQITENDVDLVLSKIKALMEKISKLLSEDEITREILNTLLDEYVKFWANERRIKRQF